MPRQAAEIPLENLLVTPQYAVLRLPNRLPTAYATASFQASYLLLI
jgi:hypothetical protein